MLQRERPFGQTASHSPSFEQEPKPSMSIRSPMLSTRVVRLVWPCGSRALCVIFADVKSAAEAVLQAATQATQPIQA